MEMTNFDDISAYIGLDGSGTPSKNYMGWTNTLQRANPFPIEMYSVFPSLAEAEAYAAGTGKYTGLPYEGQVIAVTDGGTQKVYVLDSTMSNGLRQLAAGDDASHLQEELNAEISNRISADEYLSNAISTEVENRISDVEYLSTNLSISLEDGGTPALSSVLKTYILKQGTREVGKIDIPKDFLVKSAEVKTVTEAGVPYAEAQVGDKYIDLEINAKAGDTEDSHIYIPIKDFFSPYLPGETDTISVDIGSDNTISAVVKDGSIGTVHLSSKAVTTEKIADGAVGTTQLSDDAVTNEKIADNAVDTAQIADGAVQTSKIADGAVLSAKIGDGQVNTTKIADSAVTTDKINNLAVTSDKLATDSVTNEKIADNAVGTNELSAAAVTTAKIADEAVTTAKIDDGAVTTAKIEDVAVTNAKIADNSVDSAKLSAEAVTTAKIALSAITAEKIAENAVTETKIENGAVTTDKLAGNAVTNEKLGLSAVTMDNLSSDVIDFIENQTSDAKEYVDNKISAISGDWTSAASKTVVSASQRDGKVTLSAVDIAIQASQVVDLSDVVGNYVPLSVASDSASSTDKLQTASEVSAIAEDYAVSAIESLDVDPISISANQTITQISEADGKISVVTNNIQIDIPQVNGLTSDLASFADNIINLSIDVSGLESNKLDKSEFNALSNEIGLSAATSANPVVTKDDIKNLAGAMHFKGAVDNLSTVTSADPGDVVIVIATSKEYVYNGEAGSAYLSTDWIELGDEQLYATKAEVDVIRSQLTTNDEYLSTSIDEKIYIDGVQAKTLSAIHISQDDFYQKVATSSILSNELYIVSSDYINAYDAQIKNVAEPTMSSDAATKKYVDTAVAGAAADVTELSGKVGELLSNALTGVVLNGVDFTVDSNVATLSIDVIDCGTAS